MQKACTVLYKPFCYAKTKGDAIRKDCIAFDLKIKEEAFL